MLFQHIPVKETWKLLREVPEGTDGAVKCHFEGLEKWYVLDESKVIDGKLGEAPCSEDFDTITGQYQSWLKKGDIVGGWFAHDHVNTFCGYTDDGILLGYNGGSTFRTYGKADRRTARVFDIDENDPANYETHLEFYEDVIGESGFSFADIFTPALLTYLMKVVYALFGWAIELFK